MESCNVVNQVLDAELGNFCVKIIAILFRILKFFETKKFVKLKEDLHRM